MRDAWECDEEGQLGGVPDWLEQDITPCDVAAIVQGGCASGAYMPAVTYHQADATMAKHGDDVLTFIEQYVDQCPTIAGESWSGYACKVLSFAVELWARGALVEYEEGEDEEEEL